MWFGVRRPSDLEGVDIKITWHYLAPGDPVRGVLRKLEAYLGDMLKIIIEHIFCIANTII